MTNKEKHLIIMANKIPFSKIIRCPDKKGVVRCPFPENHEHGDRHRSGYYYKETNMVHCFTFHKTWTPVLFVTEKLGCDKTTAAKLLLKKFGSPAQFYTKPKLKLETNFETLKGRKWAELKESFSCEPDFAGIVTFINEMELTAKKDDLELFDAVQIDCYRMKALIEEGKECLKNQKPTKWDLH